MAGQKVCQHPKLVDSFVSTILVLFRTPDNFVRYMFSFFISRYNPISHFGSNRVDSIDSNESQTDVR